MRRIGMYLNALYDYRAPISILAVILIASNIIVAAVFGFGSSILPATLSAKSANIPLVGTRQVSIQGQEYEILTNAQGQTLYYFYYLGSDIPKTACTGECTTTWHPLLLTDPSAIMALKPEMRGQLKAVSTTNGLQVQYNGHFLYTYSGDTMPGQMNGNGSTSMGNGLITEIAVYSSISSDNQSAVSANFPLIKSIDTLVNGKGYEILTNAQGLTLYYSNKRSACTDECTASWHPLLTTSSSIVTLNLSPEYQDLLAAVPGPNGLQVQYLGHFLYTYSGDKEPSDITGPAKDGWMFAH